MDWLVDRFKEAPEKLAFIHDGRLVTYKQVVDTISTFQLQIQGAQIKAGDIVVVVGDYSPEVFCLTMALALNKSIVIPLTKDSVIDESIALRSSGSDWYIQFASNGQDFKIEKRSVPTESQLVRDFRKKNEPGMILYSSGSTGLPKGMLYNFSRVLEKFRHQRKATIAIPFLMIDHFGGINTILSIVSSLGTVVTVIDRSVKSICRAIENYNVELLPTTPSFLTTLVASNICNQFKLSSIKRISYGTEVMPQSTLDRVRATFPEVELLQTYGLSEVGVMRSQSRGDGSLWVKLGGAGFETKVIDDILWVKSDFAMEGYINAKSEFNDDGWFNTQDRVEVDGEYFKILGRTTDIINVGGQKVYPAEIENFLLQVDNVLDVSVYGETSPMLGQMVVAKFQLKELEPINDLKRRIRLACHGKISAYKIPSKVLISEVSLYSSRQKKVRTAVSVSVDAASKSDGEVEG